MSVRRGFTLLELLVVMSVIAVLAGLLVPIVGMVRRMANDYKCGNNLQQIAGAIEAYKGENDDAFPEKINDSITGSTSDLMHSGGPLRGLRKIIICPFDGQSGQDPLMGRAASWEDLRQVKELNSSFLYEISREDLNAGQIGFFYKDLPSAARPALATWAEGKHNQKQFGNLKEGSTSVYGDPFSGTQMPIIRCYWHHKWTGTNRDHTVKKVNNVTWDLNVLKTTPYWEHDANPDIPLPTR